MHTLERTFQINIGPGIRLKGDLDLPVGCNGLVIFAHGSGSSRLSPRNRYVAKALQRLEMGTLLIDLLTEEEDRTYRNRFDIDLLTDRLIQVTRYAQTLPDTAHLPIGYFGASTGAASALKAAAKLGRRIEAIVSRGGRPDLAMDVIDRVQAPTLLIVGSLDHHVLQLNQLAYDALTVRKKLEIVNGAGHLFEEPGKLEEVASLASGWFAHFFEKS